MCLYIFNMTHFRGQGRYPGNNFVAFLENLRHHRFVLRLTDLQTAQAWVAWVAWAQPKPQILSHKKSPHQDFIIKDVFKTCRQFHFQKEWIYAHDPICLQSFTISKSQGSQLWSNLSSLFITFKNVLIENLELDTLRRFHFGCTEVGFTNYLSRESTRQGFVCD